MSFASWSGSTKKGSHIFQIGPEHCKAHRLCRTHCQPPWLTMTMTSTKMTIKDDVEGGAGNHFLRIWKEPETTFDFPPPHILSIPYNNPNRGVLLQRGILRPKPHRSQSWRSSPKRLTKVSEVPRICQATGGVDCGPVSKDTQAPRRAMHLFSFPCQPAFSCKQNPIPHLPKQLL